MQFFTALGFLTSIPVPRRWTPGQPGSSTGYFPLVGLLLGLVLAGTQWLFALVLPAGVVSALLLVLLVLLTGALHLDGFMDTCDGLGGHKTPEERWAAMRDSRAGAFGVIGAVLLILVKYASLNSLSPPLAGGALILMTVASRWAMVYVIFAHPYARPSGLGRGFKAGTGWPQLALATAVAIAVSVALAGWPGLLSLAGIWLITVALSRYLRGKFAGLTGDCYGAVNEVAEVAVLLIVLVLGDGFPLITGR